MPNGPIKVYGNARGGGKTVLKSIALGPNSPLRSKAKKLRLGFTESQMQKKAIELLVGDRRTSFGMIEKYPHLRLLYAIPNQRASKGETGRMRGEGALAGMCDLCYPMPHCGETGAMRYAALYIEVKLKGEKPRPNQREVIGWLRLVDNAVVICRSVEEIIEAVTTWSDGNRHAVAAMLDKYYA